ncbi:deoxyhypusine synthase family protein [Engelhardtia mirabilis]|uniref:Deoxyhypusine synthase-like protein n=1 Tax=Engelhardtia mirabilis TaxID=2528011 RepID=A0A518BRB8_9BACT|nr:deoxyhypusine synthase-like protein [Planctomycetes bacterium Pla133]QDV03835.1 deoxyhypusine synthase-like protein [Planctomycetes bacterium Pla86]
MSTPVSDFIRHHYRHFNAATLIDAADGYVSHLERGGKMMVTVAGAMSTAELGLSLAEMIRAGKVDAITCTGANLEEDVFNLVAHDHYVRIPNYRDLGPEDEKKLEDSGLNRVTDTCIPEEQAFRAIEEHILALWKRADDAGERYFPHEFMYQLLREKLTADDYHIDPKDSWLLAACERDLPIFVPGWEDSTLGNIFVSHVVQGHLAKFSTVKSGPEYMGRLIEWYREESRPAMADKSNPGIGFFQIAGGIAGDFPICVVPLIHQDMGDEVPYWGYFCQISDSTTSYGSYSGAVPNEKISWGKLAIDTPKFVIESDATIVAPLIFARVLGW